MKKAICTIVSNNYLGSAKSLFESVTQHCNDDIDFVCLIVDKKHENVDYDKLGFEIAWPEDFLDKQTILEMGFKYDVVEFNTSLKPFFLNYLFNEFDYERLFYFDPDTYLFNGIERLEEYLNQRDVILTPHIVDAVISAKYKDIEENVLKNGIYNLGFLGINKTEETQKLLEWWMVKLKYQCFDDKNCFVDQKWMNYAPAYFSNVLVIRDKSYNIAKWNYFERNIDFIDGIYYVDNDPMCFFHFSGYKAGDVDEHIEIEYPYSECKNVLKKLFLEYKSVLERNSFFEFKQIPYCYNFYSNGMVISKLNRRLYRSLLEDGESYDNPFQVEGNKSLYSLFKRNNVLSNRYMSDGIKITIEKDRKMRSQAILNTIMRFVKKIIGVNRYELLLNYFANYCNVDCQKFLLGSVSRFSKK